MIKEGGMKQGKTSRNLSEGISPSADQEKGRKTSSLERKLGSDLPALSHLR